MTTTLMNGVAFPALTTLATSGALIPTLAPVEVSTTSGTGSPIASPILTLSLVTSASPISTAVALGLESSDLLARLRVDRLLDAGCGLGTGKRRPLS